MSARAVRGVYVLSLIEGEYMSVITIPVVEEAHVVPRRILSIERLLFVLHFLFVGHFFLKNWESREMVTE